MFIDIEHLAKLARIRLLPGEKEKFHHDLEGILEHFRELEKLDTKDVRPMTGGTELKNVLREDFSPFQAESEEVVKAFPESKDGYLKVPKVFD